MIFWILLAPARSSQQKISFTIAIKYSQKSIFTLRQPLPKYLFRQPSRKKSMLFLYNESQM